MSNSREAALAPLHGVKDAVAALRIGDVDALARRSAVLRIIEASEAALRRLLRSEPSAPLELRLRALAPDEMTADELVAALRQRDVISLELAAAFHDLQRVQRKLLSGGEANPRDAELSVEVAERLEREATLPPAAEPPPRALPDELTLGEPVAFEPPVGASRSAVRDGYGASWQWALAAVGVLLLVGLGLWLLTERRAPSLDEGIALFRTGDFARARSHFEQVAEARPRDPTPRLYLARIHRRSGQLEQAQQELRLALEVAPEDPALHRELGFLLLDANRAEAAVARFRSAVERDPESAEGWVGLIRALRESGQIAAADRLLARAPGEVRALLQAPTPTAPAAPTTP